MSLKSIDYDNDSKKLKILDQLRLPHETIYVDIDNVEMAHRAIKDMVVRGAPAIAIVAVLGLASELHHAKEKTSTAKILEKLDYLITARPTAVNLAQACNMLKKVAQESATPVEEVIARAEQMIEDDIQDNTNIGNHGATWASQGQDEKFSVVTICNTGSLATAGYGTALGVIRSLHVQNKLKHAYCLETRPYNQGSRLTAYEFVHDNIPSTMVCDSMVSSLLRRDKSIKLIVAGADRVAANGDTANKIGTYQLAILAKHFGVKFMVAAPTTSIDLATKSGDDIVIEERAQHEVTHFKGPEVVNGELQLGVVKTICSSCTDINVWNPAFDVTPADLVDAIVTEKQVYTKQDGAFHLS